MNYSKDSLEQREKSSKSQKDKKKKKGKVITLRIILITFIIGTFAAIGGGLGVVIGIIKSTPDPSSIQLRPTTNYTSFVLDADGNQIDTFSTADNRIYATLDQIPLDLQHAFIALEDERFYEHNGIDIRGIFRAIVTNLKNRNFSEGASTLTQQLIKNNVLTSEKKITRKIQEQYLAIELEKLYPKDTILEYYLNTAALGQGVSGVQAASNRYFGKDVSELSLTECVVIAVITQKPTYYNPIKNPENNWEKVKLALNKMEEQGYITAEEHAAALLENPYDNIQEVHKEYEDKSTHSYFVDTVLEQVIDDLQSKLGYNATKATNEVYGGGLTIKTTMDSNMQAIADKYINDESLYPSSLYELKVDYSISVLKADGTTFTDSARGIISGEGELDAWKAAQLEKWGVTDADTIQREAVIKQPQPQAAFVLMDYRTGQVKALAGGRGDKTNLGFNFATDAQRQPGSTFKILAAYAPAIDLGQLSPGSILMDEPLEIKLSNGKTYNPKNWDGIYAGPTTVRKAIYHSMNVLAVKTVKDIVGIDTAFDYLQNFGFTTLVDSDRVYALPLGGITNGVTALELNAAYAAIANDGTYVKPVFYTQVLDSNGKVILDNTGEVVAENSHTVIQSSTAHMLTDMMQDVINIGTGGRVKSYFTSQPVAGKTGTTSDNKDLVFAGYTPYYAATIWTGYDQPKPLNNANNYHLTIWAKIMNEIHEGLPRESFPEIDDKNSSGVQELRICSVSNKLATALCEQDENHSTHLEYFTDGTAPTEYCDVHVEVEICSESGKVVNDYCPTETRVKKIITRTMENGSVVPDEICDIHGPDTETTPEEPIVTPEEPDFGTWPDFPNEDTSTPESPENNGGDTEVQPPSVPAEPSLPPVVVPPSANPDDNDDFFIPQE